MEETVETVEETVDSTEQENQEPDFNTVGKEFSDTVVKDIHAYGDKLPLVFMVKILNNLVADLIFQQVAIQAQYKFEALKEQLTPKSKIIL